MLLLHHLNNNEFSVTTGHHFNKSSSLSVKCHSVNRGGGGERVTLAGRPATLIPFRMGVSTMVRDPSVPRQKTAAFADP